MQKQQIAALASILSRHVSDPEERQRNIEINKLKSRPTPEKIHHTMGVYNNGDCKHNGVHPNDLKDHIEYNLRMRPGRAFFVDGLCLNNGYLSQERIDEIVEELATKPVVMNTVTLPYQ